MQAPNRSETVALIWDSFPPDTLVEIEGKMQFPNDDVRRVYLLETLIPQLNRLHPEDEGKWGALDKTERDHFIPSDIVVWRDTREHWDVLTNSGPAWLYDGPIATTWEWLLILPVGGGLPHEEPPIVDPPVEGPTLADLMAELKATHARVDEIMGKLEHYDREFKAIQPQLELLLKTLSRGGGIDDILGGIFRRG